MVKSINDQLIREFIRLIKYTPDDHNGIIDVIDFFNIALRYKHGTPPYTEFVTILRYKKPVLYRYLKKSIPRSSALQHVLALETDYHLALERLNISETELDA